jgi:aldose 1-epimerase
LFKINYIENTVSALNYIELKNSNRESNAKIYLNLGGSLQELILQKKIIIKSLHPITYEKSYASAVLFPFVNRIEDGKYTFQEKAYELEINQIEENNALHGLIFNKNFSIHNQNISEDFASVTINYTESKKQKGFPFDYTVFLKYTLTEASLTLEVTIKNEDQNSFPFNIGWHPYFYSSNLSESFLKFKSSKKLDLNEKMIPVKIENHVFEEDMLQIKDSHLDDCFILENENISFTTPNYTLKINSSSKENYLQLYTPKERSTIAIEPMTAAPNSFNNKLGLQLLKSGETFVIDWSIKLDTQL